MLRVGIVGAGRIGTVRARVAAAHPASRVTVVCDVDPNRAATLAGQHGVRATTAWDEVTGAREVDLVVVATTHDALAEVTVAALEAGKHVLCEKPMGRNAAEARRAVAAARRAGRCLKAGYNHRYHPAVQAVQRACEEGVLGPLLSLRGRYGHGGRPGYDREWRADPARAGGGELLDQGAHLLDLALWLFGDFAEVAGFAGTLFWDMPLEDNAFGLFRTAAGQVASLHVSWTQWRNLFSLELFGREGYAVATGLGGSYGPEQARIGRRRVEGGVPTEELLDFPAEDRSWESEWEDMIRAVETGGRPLASGEEAVLTLEWIGRLYRAASEGRVIRRDEDPGPGRLVPVV
ncbi:MAG: Gfo/Idh/MocA family oxidoreductase [Candidatus Latescibacterota bacterium]|jgi:predicted dehydrogenase